MEKIDSGYFCDVFDLRNGRVLKRKRSFWQIRKKKQNEIKRSFLLSLFKTYKHIRDCQRSNEMMINKRIDIPRAILGNPVFINKTDYEQDKVVTLIEYCNTHTIEEGKVIIDKYINLVRLLIKYGIHDYVYKFKNSYGVNKDGEVVFIDFNEITTSKERVLFLIQSDGWKKEAQFRKQNEGDFKEYLREKFQSTITPSMVDKEWGILKKL